MKKIFVMLVLSGILIANLSFAEELTITTYYPAPFGVYEELRAGEFYGYDTNYNLVEVQGVSAPPPDTIYYGVDPEAISDPSGLPKDGSFLRQLYVGSGLGYATGSGTGSWSFDGRTALYVRQPYNSGQTYTTGIYSGTAGQNAYAINGSIIYEENPFGNPLYPSPGSVAVFGYNPAEATGTQDNERTYGVKGVTGSGADGGVGVYGLSETDNGIAVYAQAHPDAQNRSGRAIVAEGKVSIEGAPGNNVDDALLYLNNTRNAYTPTLLIDAVNTQPVAIHIRHQNNPQMNLWRIMRDAENVGADFRIQAKNNNQWLNALNIDFETGDIGIGVTDPVGILHVGGTALTTNDGRDIILQAENGGTTGNTDGGDVVIIAGTGHGSGNNGNVIIRLGQ